MAGKIPQSFIDDLIDRTDIVELIDSRVKLKKTGRNYSACCPFHDEKTPSFSVNPDKQFYYCFGCGAGGNVISFLMDYDRSEFIESIESLAAHSGVQVPREHNPEAEKQQKAKKSIYDLLDQANQFYQTQLRQHPTKMLAVDYLKGRGLSAEIAKEFQIGFAPAGWDNLLKKLGTLTSNSEEQINMLEEGGMLIEKDNGGHYDRFRERLMFPIRDSRGRTIAFGGRVFNDDKPKYLNSPETPVFHKQQELYGLYEARQANRHLQRLVMVEGYMDVVALAQFGINYAVATLGTAAGAAHMEKVFRQCSEVIFCFDGDDAGRKAATRALEAVIPLMQAGRQAKFLFLPQGEDPDSFVRSIGHDAFVMQLDDAMSLSEYLFQVAETGLDLTKMDDRAHLVSNIMPQINTMPAGTFQELMLRSLSEKSGLPIDDIKRLENKEAEQKPEQSSAHITNTHHESHFGAPEEAYWDPSQDTQPSISERNNNFSHPFNEQPKQRQKIPPSLQKVQRTPVRTAIALLLFEPTLISHMDEDFNFSEEDECQLLAQISAHIRQEENPQTGAIMGYWLSKNKADITPLLALDFLYESEEAKIEEFQQSLSRIQQQHLRQQLSHLKNALTTETDHDKAKALAAHALEVIKLEKNS